MRTPKRPLRALLDSLEPRLLFSATFESINGTNNNLANPFWGSAGVDLLRRAPAAYADAISAPAGANRPSARAVSNAINTQTADLENNRHLSDMVYVFGQFLDHDLDLTTSSATPFNIAVPTGDPSFDPTSTGSKIINFTRSNFDPTTGTSAANPLQQPNSVTAFIDGSQIYGSDSTRAAALRSFSGGHLKTSAGNLLPFNTAGLANANDAHIVPDSQLFLAGDVRANENIELTALQTLFMREHNRLADKIAADHPGLSDEELYQRARQMVIAELQSITYTEFLPALLGPLAPGPYTGYKPNVNPGIATEFSTAAYRFGHSVLDGEIGRVNNDGTDLPGTLELRNAFFNPTLLDPTLPGVTGNIDPYLKGMISGNAQEIDVHLVDDVRNFLFGPPGAGGFDLASLNIQRGRDHGLPDFNTLRAAYGLPKVTTFAQITSDPALQASLASTYQNVNNIDAWVGGLAEDHAPNSSLGPTFSRIIADQFSRLRDGDRYYFQNISSPNPLAPAQLDAIAHTHLADIIRLNTSVTTVQPNVFLYNSGDPTATPPHLIPPNPAGPRDPHPTAHPGQLPPPPPPPTNTTTPPTNTSPPPITDPATPPPPPPPPPPTNVQVPPPPPPGMPPPPPPDATLITQTPPKKSPPPDLTTLTTLTP